MGDYYLRARYYDADTGRFIRRDTYEGSLSDPLTLHKYLYTHNNPINGVDPTGLFTLTERASENQIFLILATITFAGITTGSYNPERLGGFAEEARPRTVLDTIFAWKNTWSVPPLGGFGEGSQPSVSTHTGHPIPDLLDLISYIFEASGSVPGVLEINSRTGVAGAVRNYKPKNGQSIEFVYDPVNNVFAVGKPREVRGLESPHEALARVSGADHRAVLGGMFNRGSNGEILTNEYSGHYGQRWNEQNRRQFIEFLEQATGYPVKHREWDGG